MRKDDVRVGIREFIKDIEDGCVIEITEDGGCVLRFRDWHGLKSKALGR